MSDPEPEVIVADIQECPECTRLYADVVRLKAKLATETARCEAKEARFVSVNLRLADAVLERDRLKAAIRGLGAEAAVAAILDAASRKDG